MLECNKQLQLCCVKAWANNQLHAKPPAAPIWKSKSDRFTARRYKRRRRNAKVVPQPDRVLLADVPAAREDITDRRREDAGLPGPNVDCNPLANTKNGERNSPELRSPLRSTTSFPA